MKSRVCRKGRRIETVTARPDRASQPNARGALPKPAPLRSAARPPLKRWSRRAGLSNSVHGRAERTQCSRRPARTPSQAPCQHRLHSTASFSRACTAARLAIGIAINDRSFVERSQCPRGAAARRTRHLGTTLAPVASTVHDLDKLDKCDADPSESSAGRSFRRAADREREPQPAHQHRISGRPGGGGRRRAQHFRSAHASPTPACRRAGGAAGRARSGNRAGKRTGRQLGPTTPSAASGQSASLKLRRSARSTFPVTAFVAHALGGGDAQHRRRVMTR